jgi:hypothetical protein
MARHPPRFLIATALTLALLGLPSLSADVQPAPDENAEAMNARRVSLDLGLRRAADLRRDRPDRRPLELMLRLVLQDHADRPLPNLR